MLDKIYNYNILINSLEEFKKDCDLPIFKIYYFVIINGFLKIINLHEKYLENDNLIEHAKDTLFNISINYLLISAISTKYDFDYWYNFIKESDIEYKLDLTENGRVKLFI